MLSLRSKARNQKEIRMKFELRRVRTTKVNGEQNSIIGKAKCVLLLGDKPNYKKLTFEASHTITAAELRGGMSPDSAEVFALKALVQLASSACRNYEAEQAAEPSA